MNPLIEAGELVPLMLVFARLAGWVVFDPFLGAMPVSVRLVVAGGLTAAFAPGLESLPGMRAGAPLGFAIAGEFALGALMAWALALIWGSVRLAVYWVGHAATGGWLATSPTGTAALEAPWRLLAWLLAAMAFAAAGGLPWLLAALQDSFARVPVGTFPEGVPFGVFPGLVAGVFASAVTLALPLMFLVLLVMGTAGVVARFALAGGGLASMGLALGASVLLAGWMAIVPGLARHIAGWLPALSGVLD